MTINVVTNLITVRRLVQASSPLLLGVLNVLIFVDSLEFLWNQVFSSNLKMAPIKSSLLLLFPFVLFLSSIPHSPHSWPHFIQEISSVSPFQGNLCIHLVAIHVIQPLQDCKFQVGYPISYSYYPIMNQYMPQILFISLFDYEWLNLEALSVLDS